MKTILIATDFSAASRNASLYGVQFAKAIKANIILFNAFRFPAPAPALSISISRYDIMMQTDKLLLDEGDFLDPKRELIEVICDEGVATDAILNTANEKKVDFIITGMKGNGKNLKTIFGSTTVSLAQNTNIPVIIVHEDAVFKNPDIIMFANDSNIASDKEIPEKLIAIKQIFQSKLYEVEMNSDIKNALIELIQKHDADLLVMKQDKEGWAEHFFSKSEIKDLIFHIKIPLLVLPEVNPKTRFISKKELQNKALVELNNFK